MPDVYVVAGSNIEPGKRLQQALALLTVEFGPLRVSPAYRNKTVGFAGEDFINLAIGFATDQRPARVIERLQLVEERCGRPRNAPKWQARSMDLDIVLYGDLVCTEPGLVLPRPDLVRRAYMLKPMTDIAPDVVHPTLGRRLVELWDQSGDHEHMLQPVELDQS